MTGQARHTFRDQDLAAAFRFCRQHIVFAFVFNAFTNVLLLSYPVFMIHVYDRVVPAKSWETLVALLIGLLIAVTAKGIFHWVRGVLFVRASVRLDSQLGDRLLKVLVRRAAGGFSDASGQLLRDLDTYRQFVTGKGGIAAIEIPWGFLFLGVLMVIDTTIGVVSLLCMVVLTLATIANSVLTKRALIKANQAAGPSYQFGDGLVRAAEAIIGMGMLDAVARHWRRGRDVALTHQYIASSRGLFFVSFMGSARILMQGLLLAAGAIQIIDGAVPPGVVFASLFIFQFAMKPIDQLVSAWEEYLPVKEAMRRLDAALANAPEEERSIRLPRPTGKLVVQDLTFVPPGSDKPILKRLSFIVQAGSSLGLVGLNGSGKTTLARVLVGTLKPSAGTVRLDGADLQTWNRDELGEHVGYLPQTISLLQGTVADNIGRFGRFSDEDIIAAAKRAGAHDMILRLPKGYETPIGEGSLLLSGGQRQLIALARAIVGRPAFVVLDEPNSNLDGPGEEALVSCLHGLKEIGTTVILITHRPNLVVHLDQAAVLRDGTIVSFGSTADVFQRLGRPTIVKKVGTADA